MKTLKLQYRLSHAASERENVNLTQFATSFGSLPFSHSSKSQKLVLDAFLFTFEVDISEVLFWSPLLVVGGTALLLLLLAAGLSTELPCFELAEAAEDIADFKSPKI